MIFDINFVYTAISLIALFSFIFFISTIRSYLMYRCFTNIPFVNVLRASISGNFYGIFNIPLLGNLLGQNYHLEKINIPVSLSSMIMIFERALLLGSGFFILACVVFFYHSDLHLNDHKGLIFSLLEIGGVLSIVLCATFGRNIDYSQTLSYVLKNKINLLAIFIVNILQWMILTLCFSFGPYLLSGQELTIQLLVIAFVCGMVSSLPIHVAGFGLREVVCVSLFSFLGITTAIALEISVLIGVCAIAAICILYITRNVWIKPFALKKNENWVYPVDKKNQIDFIILKGVLLLISIMILFQIHYVSENYRININIADPLALIGCVYAVILLVKREKTDYPIRWVICVFSALFIGFLVSLYKSGFNGFSFVNKLFGFLVLVGYSYIGYIGVKAYGRNILKTVVRFQMIAFLIICFWKLIALIFVKKWKFLEPVFFPHHEFEGFLQDRNAFGFALLIVLSMYYFIQRYMNESKSSFPPSLVGFLWFCLYFSHSRTACVAALFVICYGATLEYVSVRPLIKTLLYAFLYGLLINNEHIIFHYIKMIVYSNNKLYEYVHQNMTRLHDFSGLYSDNERFFSIIEGLRLFIKNWFFGSGLGVFKTQYLDNAGKGLIIHNSYVWILAEMGLLGALLIFTMPVRWVWGLIKTHVNHYRKNQMIPFEYASFSVLLLIFILFALPHDVFYQRIFWFWFGLCGALYFPTLKTIKYE